MYSTIVPNGDMVSIRLYTKTLVFVSSGIMPYFIPIHSLTAVARFYKMKPFSPIQIYISLVNHLQKWRVHAFVWEKKASIVILEGDSW
jgi:hypothetical protein